MNPAPRIAASGWLNRSRLWLAAVGPGMTLITVAVWLLLIPSMLGPVGGDYGVFVSVAERLIAGDSLYVGVWDNKDPLYFYSLAVARLAAPWGPWLLEVGSLVLFAVGSVAIARALGLSWRLSILTGAVCAPVIVTGMTDAAAPAMPGTAFAVLSVAAAARRRWVLSGSLLALVLLSKFLLAPVDAAVVAGVLLSQPRLRSLIKTAVGFVLSAVALAGVMAVRGELLPYFDSLLLNVTYSQEGSGSLGVVGSLTEHLSRSLFTGWTAASVLVVAGMLLLSRATPTPRQTLTDGAGGAVTLCVGLWWGTAISLATAIGVLAVVGKWPGHARLLAVPMAVALIVAVAIGPAELRRRVPAAVASILVFGYVIAGLPPISAYVSKVEWFRSNLHAQTAVSNHAQLLLRTSDSGEYARVGQGDDPGHAIGLGTQRLVCPRITQYWWESADLLGSTLDCLPQSRTILVVDSPTGGQSSPQWEEYLLSVEALIAADYSCVREGNARVCVR